MTLNRIFTAFLFAVLFFWNVSADTPQEKPSSESLQDSLQASEDTTQVTFRNEQWLNQLQGRAMIRLWSWDNEEKFSYSLEIYYAQLNAIQMMPDLGRMISLSDPYANPEYDFRDDPAYRLAYAREIVAPEHGKPGNVLWVSPLTAVYLAYLGFREIGSKYFRSSKDPYEGVSLSTAEIEMAWIIWENPDLSAVDWYRAYYQRNESKDITFLVFQRRIDELLKKKIIAARRVFNEGNRYTPAISRSLLIRKIEEQWQSGDAISDSLRYQEFLRMRGLLEEESGIQDSVQTR
jgi:hypothetical protein